MKKALYVNLSKDEIEIPNAIDELIDYTEKYRDVFVIGGTEEQNSSADYGLMLSEKIWHQMIQEACVSGIKNTLRINQLTRRFDLLGKNYLTNLINHHNAPATMCSEYSSTQSLLNPLPPPLEISLETLARRIQATLPRTIDDYRFGEITSLILTNCGLKDDFFSKSVFLPCNLSILVLAYNSFTKIPYELLAAHLRRGLNYLDFSWNQLQNVDFSRLIRVRDAVLLDFNHDMIVENAENYITTSVSLRGCNLGPMVPQFTRLKRLILSDNPNLTTPFSSNALTHLYVSHCSNLFTSSNYKLSECAIKSLYPNMEMFVAHSCRIINIVPINVGYGFEFACELFGNPIIHTTHSKLSSLSKKHTTILDRAFHLPIDNGRSITAKLMPKSLLERWFDPKTCMTDLKSVFLNTGNDSEFWQDMTSPGYMTQIFGSLVQPLRGLVVKLSLDVRQMILNHIPYHALALYLCSIICPDSYRDITPPFVFDSPAEQKAYFPYLTLFKQIKQDFLRVLEALVGVKIDAPDIIARENSNDIESIAIGPDYEKYFSAFLKRPLLDLKKLQTRYDEATQDHETLNKIRNSYYNSEVLIKEFIDSHPDVKKQPEHYFPTNVLNRRYSYRGKNFYLTENVWINEDGSKNANIEAKTAEEVIFTWERRYKEIQNAGLVSFVAIDVYGNVVARSCLKCLIDCYFLTHANYEQESRFDYIHHECDLHKSSNPKKRSLPDNGLTCALGEQDLSQSPSIHKESLHRLAIISGLKEDAIFVRVQNVVFPLSKILLQQYWPDFLGLVNFDEQTLNETGYANLNGLTLVGGDDLFSWIFTTCLLNGKLQLSLLESLPPWIHHWPALGETAKIFTCVREFLKMRQTRTEILSHQ
jgi:hypothetical protein